MRCTGGQQLRYLNKNYNKTYSNLIRQWTTEIVQLYGTRVDYYVYNYNINRHDYLYGEDNAANFSQPIPMTVVAKVNNDSLLLSKFGLETQAELEVYVPFDTFAQAMNNPRARPKSGDLIRLTEAGLDRPGGGGYPYVYGMCPSGDGDDGDGDKRNGKCSVTTSECGFVTGGAMDLLKCCIKSDGSTPNSLSEDFNTSGCENNPMSGWLRGPNIYEITQVQDDNIPMGLNPMLTHTTWHIKAIRFDNAYQPDAPVEAGSDQVNDSPYYGKLPGGTATPENPKLYPQTGEKENKNHWNYDKYNLDSVYGEYGSLPKESIGGITYNPTTDPYSDKYADVFNYLELFDLLNLQQGQIEIFKVKFENDTLALQHMEEGELPINPKQKILISDSSNCFDVAHKPVYALFVYDDAIAWQYVGGAGEVDDVVYPGIYMTNTDEQGNQDVMKLYIYNGELMYGKTDEEETEDGDQG